MARFLALLSIFLVFAVGSCLAVPRFRQPQRFQEQQRQRFFARQQLEPSNSTPYPTAEELRPDVPFTEESASQPEQIYGPPELIYGPPAGSSAQLPSAVSPQQFERDPDAEEFLPSDAAPARLTQASLKKSQRLQKSQRLIAPATIPAVAAVPSVPAVAPILAASPFTFNLAPAQAQQYYFVNQPFAYSTEFQSW